MSKTEELFCTLEKALASEVASASSSTGQDELNRLRKENEALEQSQILLLQQLRLMTAVKVHISNIDYEEFKPLAAMNKRAKKCQASRHLNNDQLLYEVLGEVAEAIDEHLMSGIHVANMMTSNGDADGKKKTALPMTRNQKKTLGGKLINPFQYYDCLMCSKGFYRDEDLRVHYFKKHDLDFGQATLPNDELQIQCHQVDRQSSTKCYLCQTNCSDVEALRVHKSLHVDSKYCKYKCSHCTQGFVLRSELTNHSMICN
jgi:Pyruvate/2-oxoacid:ferredoxin oxidoreductase delta subunit